MAHLGAAAAAVPPAIDYAQLATNLLQQIGAGAVGGVGGAPAPPDPVAKYVGDGVDIERLESHVAKWLATNCIDIEATVRQNVRHFLGNVSNIFKEKVTIFETRDDMERMLPDAANPNALSDALVRLTKDYANANPGDVARLHGGDVRPARYE